MISPTELEEIRDQLLLTLSSAGYDTSGTDHSEPNEIEVGTDEHEFRLTITEL